MPKMVQIRNVPDDVHLELKIRAAKAGMSLSDYLLAEVRKLVSKPTLEEWFDAVWADEPVEGDWDAAELIREIRGPLGPYPEYRDPTHPAYDPKTVEEDPVEPW